jgi:hypothetical protein
MFPPRQFALYSGFEVVSWDGTNLVWGNARCYAHGDCEGYPENLDGGFRFFYHAVPLPAAGWLITPAFGVLAWARRRRSLVSSGRTYPV